MTERWRQELSKMPRLKEPAPLWDRASQGPQRPDPTGPTTRQRVMAAVVGLAVFAAAGGLAFAAFRNRSVPIGQGAEASDVLRIRCGDTGTEVLTPVVEARSDGVHVEAEHPAEARWILLIDVTLGSQQAVLETRMSLATDQMNDVGVLPQVPVGARRATCVRAAEGQPVPIEAAVWIPFTVKDPNGFYTSPELTCEPTQVVELRDLEPAEPIDPALTPEEMVASVEGVLPRDSVEMAGYVNADRAQDGWPWVRVVRAGETVASFWTRRTSVVLVDGIACAGSGIKGA